MKIFRKILKWTGIVVVGLIVLGLVSYAFIAHSISQRMERQYTIAPESIDIPTDSATIARGRHLVAIKGCNECHGENLSGMTMANDFAIGNLTAPNLTKGRGGLPAAYSTEDWLRVFRHGTTRDGRSLLLMPSQEYAVLSAGDLAAIIAYCQQLPPVDNGVSPIEVGPVAKVMAWAGKMPLFPAEAIAHGAPPVKQADTSEGVAQGKYLSVACSGCHRPNMKGGDPLAPGQPHVPDITSSGNPGRWTQPQFLQALRTGKTPSGHVLNNEDMPWKMTAQYSDKELASLYQYLKSLK